GNRPPPAGLRGPPATAVRTDDGVLSASAGKPAERVRRLAGGDPQRHLLMAPEREADERAVADPLCRRCRPPFGHAVELPRVLRPQPREGGPRFFGRQQG